MIWDGTAVHPVFSFHLATHQVDRFHIRQSGWPRRQAAARPAKSGRANSPRGGIFSDSNGAMKMHDHAAADGDGGSGSRRPEPASHRTPKWSETMMFSSSMQRDAFPKSFSSFAPSRLPTTQCRPEVDCRLVMESFKTHANLAD
ncbi:hypothetical protein [Rhizobium sp. 007]|uniref:hypothetical protein n=1 Tax=Rhizobium sp. 007 TaxID=2785056 RepID=UPI00188E3C60|nr:hypothetical protein [Rhizobium sp. 007]QPB24648.1 hypothetical protein ISN39_34670 [Rhizobium sp. 007]